MNVFIYSREEAEKLIAQKNFPKNTAVVSFYDDILKHIDEDYKPVDYSKIGCNVIYSQIRDIDISFLEEEGLCYDDYFPDADRVALFIYKAYKQGRDIVCQCEHGQSRSAACAAAVREHFSHDGIKIFTDYRYCPNPMVYHKIFDALENVRIYYKSMFYYHAKKDFIRSRIGKYCNYDELFGSLSVDGRIACINSKKEFETFLLGNNLLCESVTAAVNSFKGGNPFPFLSLHLTDSVTGYCGPLPIKLINEHKYICEKISTSMWLFDGSIKAERNNSGTLQKKEIYFGRSFDSFDVKECDVLGTMLWDERNKELIISPLIITNIVFEQYSYFSGKRRRRL